MTQSIEELAKKRRNWVEANRENDFEIGIKRLLTDLYPDNAHFIYELLQNAEDAQAQEVRFILDKDCITFEHDGKKLFSIQDVDAITSIGSSTKRDDTTSIGKFGVGFKAVFAYTDTPKIASGDFHFRILDLVVPERDSLSEHVLTNGQTLFILQFNNPKKPPNQAMSEIEKLLKVLDATTLLFLTHICKIEYILPDSSLGSVERIELGDNRFEIRVQQPNESAPSSTWFLKFDKEVQVEDEDARNEDDKMKLCRIAVAFGMSPVEAKADAKKKDGDSAKAKSEWEIAPMEPGSVCIYFPADKETSNLRFHLHAPFASTVARDSVRDCKSNDALRDHLANLLSESMHEIRDQGLLTVHTLALLPIDNDNLPEFYKPLIDRLVEEFKEHDLVPMKRGGHAPASGIFHGLRALTDLIDDDDLITLLKDEYVVPMWVANPSQRNQREDKFLSMLKIEEWDTAKLVKALGEMDKNVLAEWLESKDGEWHQTLYEMLMDYLNSVHKNNYTEACERSKSIKRLNLVRCSDGAYRKGSDCFFSTEDVEQDDKFPRVANAVYTSGKEEENKKVRDFLKAAGVRELDEKVEIESMLEEQYSQKAEDDGVFKRDINHIKKFSAFFNKNTNPYCSNMFKKFYIFKLENGKWGKPCNAYLDTPFMNTDLRVWYEMIDGLEMKVALSPEYEKCGLNPMEIGEFAKKNAVVTELQIKETSVDKNHPDWVHLRNNCGNRQTKIINGDWHIPGLLDFLKSPSEKKSRLVWRTIKDKCSGINIKYFRAVYGLNSSNIADAKSTLFHVLNKSMWVPQVNNECVDFVQPREAVAEKLPDGFEYQTGWKWLHDLEFGKGVEERENEMRKKQEHQTTEYKRKEEVVRDMGFDSPEEAEEIAKLKKENPEEFRQLKERCSAIKERPTFPIRSVANAERRQQRFGEQLSDAPDKEYEKRERNVRTTSGAIDPPTWLRSQYTNEYDKMACQICKKEMPFRKRDGAYYFEIKEVLSKKYLPKELEAQYLALCPLCAAMYQEFVKNDDDVMANLKEKLVNVKDCDVPITLGSKETSIRFVEIHLHDLKFIIEANN